MDGLGAWTSFASPAAGAHFTTTVPVGRRWRMQAGSCLLVTSGVAGRRNPFLTFIDGNLVPWAGGQDDPLLGIQPAEFVPASSTRRLVFYPFRDELRQTYASTYLPVGAPPRAMWLRAGAQIKLTVQNLDTGDQISQVMMLLEDVAA